MDGRKVGSGISFGPCFTEFCTSGEGERNYSVCWLRFGENNLMGMGTGAKKNDILLKQDDNSCSKWDFPNI